MVPIDEKSDIINSNLMTNTATAESLLKRAFLFLEEEEWGAAEKYCERVLDINPMTAWAYIGKLMVEFKVRKPNDLKDCASLIIASSNYKKAFEYGDDKLQGKLARCGCYTTGVYYYNLWMNSEADVESHRMALRGFEKIHNLWDVKTKVEELYRSCYERANKFWNLWKSDETNVELCKMALDCFRAIAGYQDADGKLSVLISDIYNKAIIFVGKWTQNNNKANVGYCKQAHFLLNLICGYKDVDNRINSLQNSIIEKATTCCDKWRKDGDLTSCELAAELFMQVADSINVEETITSFLDSILEKAEQFIKNDDVVFAEKALTIIRHFSSIKDQDKKLEKIQNCIYNRAVWLTTMEFGKEPEWAFEYALGFFRLICGYRDVETKLKQYEERVYNEGIDCFNIYLKENNARRCIASLGYLSVVSDSFDVENILITIKNDIYKHLFSPPFSTLSFEGACNTLEISNFMLDYKDVKRKIESLKDVICKKACELLNNEPTISHFEEMLWFLDERHIFGNDRVRIDKIKNHFYNLAIREKAIAKQKRKADGSIHAGKMFEAIKDYKDSENKIKECKADADATIKRKKNRKKLLIGLIILLIVISIPLLIIESTRMVMLPILGSLGTIYMMIVIIIVAKKHFF